MCCDREMPRYRCHKEVHALKIAKVFMDEAPGLIITPEDLAALDELGFLQDKEDESWFVFT